MFLCFCLLLYKKYIYNIEFEDLFRRQQLLRYAYFLDQFLIEIVEIFVSTTHEPFCLTNFNLYVIVCNRLCVTSSELRNSDFAILAKIARHIDINGYAWCWRSKVFGVDGKVRTRAYWRQASEHICLQSLLSKYIIVICSSIKVKSQ